jgi:glycosyltransferase involved in cell wall biosynthesis
MKILHTVEAYYPSVGGMQEVVKQLSERLVTLGHDVTVATRKMPERKSCNLNGVKIVEFAVSGNEAYGMIGETQKYADFLVNSAFDVMTNFAAQQWATDVALEELDRIKAKKVFVPTGFSALYSWRYVDYFQAMKKRMKKYDMNVFLSDDYRDVNFAKENGIEKRMLIPNGAGADEFLPQSAFNIKERLGIPEDYRLIMHVGSHTGVKGHTEAIKIFKRANLKKSAFLLVGNFLWDSGCYRKCALAERMTKWPIVGLPPDKLLLVRDLSRTETVAAYKAADVFLFPSNIECSPIVLFECMAAKTPFLTSDVGNAKEIIGWSQSGEILPTVKDKGGYHLSHVNIKKSAIMLEELLNDEKRRAAMAMNGFEAWQSSFSWEVITMRYEDLYKSLTSNHHKI